MTMTTKWIGAFCLSAMGGMIAGPVLAQTATEPATGQSTVERVRQAPGTPGAATRPGARTTATTEGDNLDKKIAVCLLLGNQEEIALAQFAQQRSQNAQVKKFAQQMIEHHQQAISKIEQAAPEVASLNLQLQAGAEGAAAASPNPTGVRPASAEEPVASTATAANGGHDQRGVQLAQAVKQECLNLTQQELAQQQGVEFDKAYIGQQVGAHIGMLAELRGSKNFATGQLQQVIAEGEQMTQKHLDEAKQIMSQLKDQQGSQAAQPSQRPAATRQPAR